MLSSCSPETHMKCIYILPVVKPGHSDRETITLDRYYELKPGKYRVKIRFREWASIPGVTPNNETFVIDIVSNELEFVISP